MRAFLALVVLGLTSGCMGVAEEAALGLGLEAPDGRSADAGVVAAVDPCVGVTCAHGACDSSTGAAVCRCDSGFHADADAGVCVENPPVDPCLGVTCGARASCHAGACSCEAGFQGDPLLGCTAIPGAQETTTRAELVAIATAELGNCEGVNQRPYMQYQPGLWCYDFVAWVYQQASYPLPTPISLPQYRIGSLPAGWKPRAGDLIKYTFQHYAMVESVSADGATITTLEGNYGSCVVRSGTSVSALEFIGSLASAF